MSGRRSPTRSRVFRIFGVTLILLAGILQGFYAPARAADSAVVLMYHRFGEDKYPTTSVSLEQFDAHLAELKSGDYTVLPLAEIIETLRSGGEVPDNTVAITIDDAHASLYENGWPRLKEAGFPFTLFVATETLDQKNSFYMSWDQVRELAAAGVQIGSQSVTHLHMADATDAVNRRELTTSADRIEAEIGARPLYIAYPYGEASTAVMAASRDAGYTTGFGQHSGVANAASDFFYLPRFPMNMTYGDIDRFKRVVRTLPLPVEDLLPSDPLLTQNPPSFGFTIPARLGTLPNLACYHSAFQRLDKMERLGPRRIEIRFDEKFPPGRNRINCTAPGPEGRWRWFGMQYYVPPS